LPNFTLNYYHLKCAIFYTYVYYFPLLLVSIFHFRTTIRQEISSNLAKQSIQVAQSVDETIEVAITIQSNKEVKLTSIKSSDSLLVILPSLKAILKKSVKELPSIYPAIKRGIPVTTVYKLPIRIAVKN